MYAAMVHVPCIHGILHAQQESERVQRMDAKLKELHLDGLVDFTDQAAKCAPPCLLRKAVLHLPVPTLWRTA